jgi:phosphoribosylaminoimidazole-succinocarboxamide synthase
MASGASSLRLGSLDAVFTTDLNLPGRVQGKVRDVYRLPPTPVDKDNPTEPESRSGSGLGSGRLAIIATDRLSAFDVVLPTPIPGKGCLLTEIAAFWFRWLEGRGLGPTHLLSTDASDLPESAFEGVTTTPREIEGRITIARACTVLPIECVVRGFLEGSGWVEYKQQGTVCGIKLPTGLKQGDSLPEPIFTPATKAQQGEHDENITFEQACAQVGEAVMQAARERSIAIYTAAAEHASKRGLLLADTKFEFGFAAGQEDNPAGLVLIDEVLTPDSSRYWAADRWEPGRSQVSFDKQFVREYLLKLVDAGQWNKTAPGPKLPAELVAGTLDRYTQARDLLTGPGPA